jgi:hypothetical protein
MLCSVQRPLSHAGGDAGRMDAQRLGGQHACPANWRLPTWRMLVELGAPAACGGDVRATPRGRCPRDVSPRRAHPAPLRVGIPLRVDRLLVPLGRSKRSTRLGLQLACATHTDSLYRGTPPPYCTSVTPSLSAVRSPRPRSIFTVTCALSRPLTRRTPRRRRHSGPRTLIAAVAARALHPAACRCAARFGAAPLGPPSRARAPLSTRKCVGVFAQHARQRVCPGSPRVASGRTPASALPT